MRARTYPCLAPLVSSCPLPISRAQELALCIPPSGKLPTRPEPRHQRVHKLRLQDESGEKGRRSWRLLAGTQRDPAIFRCSARGVLGLGVKSSDSRAAAAEGLSATRCTSSSARWGERGDPSQCWGAHHRSGMEGTETPPRHTAHAT